MVERRHASVVENSALLAVGLIAVSSSGPLMAAATGVPALGMALWRTGLGAAAIAPAALLRRRAELRALSKTDRNRSIVAGICLAAHFATWVSALHMTSVASATALVSIQVAWVVLIARVAGEATPRTVVFGMALALAGVVIVSGVDLSVSGRAVAGDLLAIVGGASSAGYFVIGSKVRDHTSTTSYTFVCYTACAVLLLGVCLGARVDLTGYDAKNWTLIFGVTLSAQLLGHSVFNHLLAVMSPTVASMALLLEVPGAALLAGLFLGQEPPLGVYAGLAFICAGLAVVIRARGAAGVPPEAPVD